MTKKTAGLRRPTAVIRMNADELQSHPELLDGYVKWKEDPITLMVFGMLQDLNKPNGNGTDLMLAMAADKGITGSILYAKHVGAQHMLDAAMAFDDVDAPPVEIDAEFGADGILKDEKIPNFEEK